MASSLSEALLNFTVNIYKEARDLSSDEAGNIICSPFSIAAALGMALAGSRSTTVDEITTAIHVKSADDVRMHFSELQEHLKSIPSHIALHVANCVYCEQTFQPLETYCALLKEHYSTAIVSMDFLRNADLARQESNFWVENVTRNKIRDLLPPGIVSGSTAPVLVNAVYFQGLWDAQFHPSSTHEGVFRESRERSMEVDMMYQMNNFRVGRSDVLKATVLEMPYKGENVNGYSSAGRRGRPAASGSVLTSEALKEMKELKLMPNVKVYLPKFKVEYSINLKTALQSLGVQQVFTPKADMTGIVDKGRLFLSHAVHEAFVEVNEEGTEAAAASIVR